MAFERTRPCHLSAAKNLGLSLADALSRGCEFRFFAPLRYVQNDMDWLCKMSRVGRTAREHPGGSSEPLPKFTHICSKSWLTA